MTAAAGGFCSCLFFLSLFFFPASIVGQTFDLGLELLPGATGLVEPVGVVDAGDGSGRLFIVERQGTIRIWQSGAVLPGAFLDISALVRHVQSEEGLLGLAFHPEFASNGYFFVNYTETESSPPGACPLGADCVRNTVISRFQVQSVEEPGSGDPNFTDPATEERLFTFNQPYWNHDGGDLRFGPEGYLYIALGDGGSGGDPNDFAQSTSTLLGKILRIDVDGTPPMGGGDLCGESPQLYGIPAGNPFAGGSGDCDEIWHLGLRNPWRFSFDRETADLFIGDVGQSSREEIDFRAASSVGVANWGWRCYEGTSPYDTTGCGPAGDYLSPIHDYSHSSGRCSVTGGFRYRGDDFFLLRGVYFFADFCSGEIWGAREDEGAWSVPMAPDHDAPFSISSFGEDAEGELYVTDYSNGRIHRLVETLIPEHIAPLDIDGNGELAALTDGLLILRRLFDFEAAALVAGAVDLVDCDRCDASTIEPVIDALEAPHLDVDDNGTAEALEDGLLILRYLFDFTGEALVTGAVDLAGCDRCTAAAIEAYLDTLL